ncbi:lytic transglycosylase domain-containing protein [Paracoccus sp. (in: a-proteobacteria)]|uniref:lytic transglycosylase domain-containing protein n=1 Tax=Paracoccus sp. TaxID=267 RepID=UPI00289C10E8|nr:lytic transglycosylase domain-containing protein [Paracoccus sp. (in: a-proteobacteria)]
MLYPLRDRLLGLTFAMAVAAAPAGAENLTDIAQALSYAGQRNWTEAEAAATRSGAIGTSLIAWQKLRAGQGSWPEYRDFAKMHPDFPGLELLFKRGDAVLSPSLPAADILTWFGTRRPDTLNGERAYLAALGATSPAADAELARFWTQTSLSAPDEVSFLAEFGTRVKSADDARLALLLDLGEWAAAERILTRASADAQAVAKARIAMQAGRSGVDATILALSPSLQGDAGLALDRFRWRVKNKMGDLARDLMLERSISAEALRDPGAWSGLRADYARADLRAGNWARAERFASHHFLPEGHKDYTDLEWLAGYAALRGGAPDRALTHFQRLETEGATPITRSRSLYWQGRAQADLGNARAAETAYGAAARHQTAYYGQLAAEKLGQVMTPELAVPGDAIISLPDWRGAMINENTLWQTGVWLVAAGYPEQGQRFFMQLAETAQPDDIARMARLMLELRQPWHALRLAKVAAGKGAIYPAAYFPLTGLEKGDHGIAPELVLAIARRESEFNHAANSHAGAKGLMQVMPGTAREMAQLIDEPYVFARLTTDADYNARLGAAYLRGLQNRFGYSVALISSGYNAGPGRPARWLGDFGDIRKKADPVDWVEMIPLDETRNYVMRVAESLPIYRARIMGKPAPIVPSFDLTGGGLMPAPPPPRIRLWASARPPISQRAIIALIAGGASQAVIGPALVAHSVVPVDGGLPENASARAVVLPPATPVVQPSQGTGPGQAPSGIPPVAAPDAAVDAGATEGPSDPDQGEPAPDEGQAPTLTEANAAIAITPALGPSGESATR